MALAPALASGKPSLADKLAASPMARARGDPALAARQAADDGNYGLIWGETLGSSGALDVTCLAPMWIRSGPWERSLVAAVVSYTDEIGPDYAKIAAAEDADTAFGKAYNAVIIASPNFPYPDVCRPYHKGDQSNRTYDRAWSSPATSRRPPVTSLAAAARVGSLKSVNAFLRAGAAVDTRDAFGLSPLSWALIRGHDAIALRLLKAGALPDHDALRYAVAFGRQAVLRRLWTEDNLDTAGRGVGELAQAAVVMDHRDTLLALLARTKATPDAETMSWLLTIALKHRDHAMAELLLHHLGREVPAADLFSAAISVRRPGLY